MKKEFLIYYLKIIGGCFLTSPFVFVILALDYKYSIAAIITGIFYLVMSIISILLFNYLETGEFWIK